MRESGLDVEGRLLVRLFRLWVMAREDGAMTLQRMHEVANSLGLPDQTSYACASLFQLVEHELGRPLVRECCCARHFSPDEAAIVSLVAAAPALQQMRGSQHIPHGLSGSIYWAATTVRSAIGFPMLEDDAVVEAHVPRGCPDWKRPQSALRLTGNIAKPFPPSSADDHPVHVTELA